MDRKEELRQWLEKANNDLKVAEHLSITHHPTPDEIICFHCQQSAEKYLKTFIFYNNIEPEKTHDLEELLNVCINFKAEFSTLLTKVTRLTKYGVLPRYPNELKITDEDMKAALNYAKSVQEFVLKVFKEIEEELEKEQSQT